MAIVNIGEMLRRAMEFERHLESYYASIRDHSIDNGVRLLTYYLSRHCRHLEQAIADYGEDKVKKIGEIKLKFDFDFHPEKESTITQLDPKKVKAEELLNAAIEYDEILVSFYKKILEQPLIPAAAAFIESLIHIEETDVIMQKKIRATHYF